MPKPTLPELSPRDILQIRNALYHYNAYLVRQHKDITRRRGYAFRNNDMEYEKQLGINANVYSRTISRVKNLYESFQLPTEDEIEFNEW